MPWKAGYTISDEKSLQDADIRWPDAAQCCVNIVVNLSITQQGEGLSARDVRDSDTVFMMHEALPALTDTLARHGFKATFAVPAVMARLYPEHVRRLAESGHEIAAHGYENEDVSRLSEAEENRRLRVTTDILADVCGKRPTGWFSLPRVHDPYAVGTVSDSTMRLLLDHGYRYMGNGLADDIPYYWVASHEPRRTMLVLPYYYHFDDQYFILFPSAGSGLENPDVLVRNWKAEFNAQYRRGRMFQMTLHPRHMGWGHRLYALEGFLQHMRQFPGLWSAHSEACADYWMDTWPASRALKLEECIWQDYPGSLS